VEILSPLTPEKYRSPQTLVRLADPNRTVRSLTQQGIICTKKPEGMRIATHFFVNESDIDRLIDALRLMV
jgi:selenocysteine lyase/cysteine desulfurase